MYQINKANRRILVKLEKIVLCFYKCLLSVVNWFSKFKYFEKVYKFEVFTMSTLFFVHSKKLVCVQFLNSDLNRNLFKLQRFKIKCH